MTGKLNVFHDRRCDQFKTTVFAGRFGKIFVSMCSFQFGLSEYTKSTRRCALPIHHAHTSA